MQRWLPAAVAIAVLSGSGIVHGIWTDRWHPSDAPAGAAAKLERIGLNLGPWVGRRMAVGNPADLGGVQAYFYAQYVNAHDGNEMTVFLVAGRAGTVAIHTPDVCYKASGYDVETPVHWAATTAAGSQPAEFWTAQLSKTKSADRSQLRIWWSWSADGVWQVPESPRLAFAKSPVLYKLYLIHESSHGEGTQEREPAQGFLAHLLPEVRWALFDAPSETEPGALATGLSRQ